MSTDYEPGTVAIATVRGVPNIRVMRVESNYSPTCKWASAWGEMHRMHEPRDVTDVRLLVVLDLDDYAWAAMVLRDPKIEAMGTRTKIADQIEAQTKPPRIPEPGLWGVVEASLAKNPTRGEFVCTKHGWTRVGGPVRETDDFAWESLIDPVLVREGVKP